MLTDAQRLLRRCTPVPRATPARAKSGNPGTPAPTDFPLPVGAGFSHLSQSNHVAAANTPEAGKS